MIHIIKPYTIRSPALYLGDFGNFGNFCHKVPCGRALASRGVQEYWQIFKDLFLQAQERHASTRGQGAKMPRGIHTWIRSC